MDATDVTQLLDAVAEGRVAPAEAAAALRSLPFAELGTALIDHHRSLRQGIPEAVYAPGKSVLEVQHITAELLATGSGPVIVSRADEHQEAVVVAVCEQAEVEVVRSGPVGQRTVVARCAPKREHQVLIVTAGTADGPVAEEAEAVLLALGYGTVMLRDRGVAGLHRLMVDLDVILEAEATIVVAGMEGALASVVGGLARGPVIGVPTSAGYGASLEGVTALLSMLSSCAAGVSVVGIDNGFGAAMAVHRALGAIA
jgi:pyridinium-3,5-biscarboxylic acid mononucleotide synthase